MFKAGSICLAAMVILFLIMISGCGLDLTDWEEKEFRYVHYGNEEILREARWELTGMAEEVIFAEEWVERAAELAEAVRASVAVARTVVPPDEYLEFYERYLVMIDKYEEAVDYLEKGIALHEESLIKEMVKALEEALAINKEADDILKKDYSK